MVDKVGRNPTRYLGSGLPKSVKKIFFVFFLRLSQPWRIVLPALIFSSIFFFISLGAGAQTTAAINTFCINFDEELARIRNENETVTEKCRDLDLFLQVQHVKFLSK